MNVSFLQNRKLLFAVLVTLAIAGPASAASIYTSGHGDIGLGYADGDFEPHWHLHSGAVVDGIPLASDTEYEVGELAAETASTRTSPNGLSSSLGVADGTPIYVLGSSAYPPNLGFGVEELVPADWSTDITLTLDSVIRPAGAEFALYTTNLGDTSVVDEVFSSYDPNATVFTNSFTMTPGDHVHFQWGFTQPGTYDLQFTWSGTHSTDGFKTATETFTMNVIPEPSSLLLMGVALLAGLAIIRRKR